MIKQTLFEFIDSLCHGKLSLLDSYNYLEEVTSNFEELKTDLLLRDLLVVYNTFRKEAGLDPLKQFDDLYYIENVDSKSSIIVRNDPVLERLNTLASDLKYQKQLRFKADDEKMWGDQESDNMIKVEIEEEEIEESPIDFKNLSGNEKLIYIKEIGFIDYLKCKKSSSYSNRKIAQIIGPIIGEKISTIQPVLNSIINDNRDKNNPYYNTKSNKVTIIRGQLSSFG